MGGEIAPRQPSNRRTHHEGTQNIFNPGTRSGRRIRCSIPRHNVEFQGSGTIDHHEPLVLDRRRYRDRPGIIHRRYGDRFE